MNKTYKVVVNDFMFTGGDSYDFSKATNIVETFIPIRDCLIDEIKAAKTITPKAPDYIKDIGKQLKRGCPKSISSCVLFVWNKTGVADSAGAEMTQGVFELIRQPCLNIVNKA